MRHAAIHLAAWTAAALAGVPPAGAQAPAVQAPAVQASATQAPAAQGAAGSQAMQAPAVPRVERQIASLQRRLRITPAQQPQWDAFTGVMRDNGRRQEAAAARAARPLTLTAPNDLRAHAAAAQAQADSMARLVPAFDAPYAALSPDQRAAADQVFRQFERQALRRRAAPAG